MNPVLRLALEGSNPDRVRSILASGSLPVLPEPDVAWPVEGVDFRLRASLPEHLIDLPDAPPWLFVRGHLPAEPGVAVVGSRRATQYGLEVAEQIGRLVAGAGWPVVSGLALGIDAAAHRGCLDAGGTAVAVLGSGIDRLYPRRNAALGERVLTSGGAVVSEFGPGIAPEPWRFPCRNRIISGLSAALIVVEAAERSGALITANLALSHGREVIAVPGDIRRETSRGCNRLIRDGAHPLVDLSELVGLLEMFLGPAPGTPDGSGDVEGLGALPVSLDHLIERSGLGPAEVMTRVMAAVGRGEVRLAEGVVHPA